MTNELKLIFDDSELEKIQQSDLKDRQHPLKRLLFSDYNYERNHQVLTNTDRALRHLSEKNEKWISSLKKRLLDFDDYSTSSSALGEIRAFGYLLEAGISVKPLSSGSDFLLRQKEDEEEDEVLLEVHSKQMNHNETQALEEFHQGKRGRSVASPTSPKIIVREHVTTPCGKPKKGESTTENVISKLAYIKGKEHQLSKDKTSILWLDFQDESWNLFDDVGRILPIRTWNSAFYSGEFWYAFYGWKSAIIFEMSELDHPFYGKQVKMRHDGRFLQSNKLDAVIISFSRNTIVMENPYSTKAIKPWLWKKLIYLPWFNFEYSYTNWLVSDLEQKIDLDKKKIIALSKYISL
ncbi:MAG: hypothetical protein F6K45_02295 [Kamptonema sp. SIO1D9]|nr:hypothetical protein [Kamptonema sp. SIO1D9]